MRMSLLVTGSIGIDTVTTPFGLSENCLGGSAVYFSMAASFFSPVRFVGAIGADCPFELSDVFAGRNVDLAGLEVRSLSKTFRWKGSYHETMAEAITEMTELNVLAEDPPRVPDAFRDSKFVFLANAVPNVQQKLLEQIDSPVFVAADTMNFYIDGYLDSLKKLLQKTDCLIINQDEAQMLSDQGNLIAAGRRILAMGPKILVIKKGESGSITFSADGRQFILPAFPADTIKDPTGAGDSFAGALMGYLAGEGKTDFDSLKAAVAYGTVAASYTIADFSLAGLTSITRGDIDERFEVLRQLTQF